MRAKINYTLSEEEKIRRREELHIRIKQREEDEFSRIKNSFYKIKGELTKDSDGLYSLVEFCEKIKPEGNEIPYSTYRVVELMVGYGKEDFTLYDNRTKFKPSIPKPSRIKAFLDSRVIGQEDAKKVISVAIYNHYKRIEMGRSDISKSNILMLGPSGCGKTEIARAVAEMIDVPFHICDATTFTEAGYVGDDVDNALLGLYQAADRNLERTEKGIIFVDEIDKLARKGQNTSITRDVSGEGVQQALLKIIEGSVVDVSLKGGRKHPMETDRVKINTSNILFICSGAFENLTMTETQSKPKFGFLDTYEEPSNERREITAEDVMKEGIIPELMGRLPIIATLEPLSQEILERILVEPKNSITKQYSELLKLDGVDMKWDPSVISHIAEEAYSRKTGARGLKSIIEKTMTDFMFYIPDQNYKGTITLKHEDGKYVFQREDDEDEKIA